jgi:hypothetical protein
MHVSASLVTTFFSAPRIAAGTWRVHVEQL